jgi:hypothetical protein
LAIVLVGCRFLPGFLPGFPSAAFFLKRLQLPLPSPRTLSPSHAVSPSPLCVGWSVGYAQVTRSLLDKRQLNKELLQLQAELHASRRREAEPEGGAAEHEVRGS